MTLGLLDDDDDDDDDQSHPAGERWMDGWMNGWKEIKER
jgi:hypothetical protein